MHHIYVNNLIQDLESLHVKQQTNMKLKYRGVVVEQSRASKSDNLVMLKVESSNPGDCIHIYYFRDLFRASDKCT